MSETDTDNTNLEETYSDEPTYTVDLNEKRYELNEDARRRVQDRAKHEYKENNFVSCWWKTASQEDAEESDIHEAGDPILVIETEGPMVPWEKLDQLELEMQDTSSFDGFDDSDNDAGNGMKTIERDDDDTREKNRTHFEVTPQDFEEVPSPDGENPDKVPPKPKTFDEPTMVMWLPENPDIDHTWSAGEAIAPMHNWVEWNVQAKADQPRPVREKDNSHDHWESLLQSDDCEVVAERAPSQEPPSDNDTSGESDDVPKKFKEGTAGGGHWNV